MGNELVVGKLVRGGTRAASPVVLGGGLGSAVATPFEVVMPLLEERVLAPADVVVSCRAHDDEKDDDADDCDQGHS